ncbi:hypothetical protein E1200_27025 [Actinomadura sp. GC306]|uniref:hypothetical protein n=1 Tax=Actinomadura sp. GC306 TaxID=2530367 RepID=UPI0010509F1C|nr:hypothetical protein [Actinomadura sp. GC306]TDC62084.1 hypothetical protein E1200_27025 [Actinomadura sp. GC306]
MDNTPQNAENHHESSRTSRTGEGQQILSPWLLLGIITCVVFWTVAIWLNGPTAIAILGILGAVTGATMTLVALTSGRIDQRVARFTLWTLSCCAIPFLLVGFNARYLTSKDARLSPQDFHNMKAGDSFTAEIMATDKRTYLALRFDVTPRNQQAAICGGSIRLSVQLSWQSGPVELKPGTEKDIRLGSPPAKDRKVIMTVQNVEPNSTCTVNVHLQGTLHR